MAVSFVDGVELRVDPRFWSLFRRRPFVECQASEAIRVIKQSVRPRGRNKRHSSLYPVRMERDIVVLWGMYRGWSNPVIADAVKSSVSTVERLRRRFAQDPSLVFNCPVLQQGIRGTKPLWRCEFCGASLLVTEKEAREHVAGHLFSKEILALQGVMPAD